MAKSLDPQQTHPPLVPTASLSLSVFLSLSRFPNRKSSFLPLSVAWLPWGLEPRPMSMESLAFGQRKASRSFSATFRLVAKDRPTLSRRRTSPVPPMPSLEAAVRRSKNVDFGQRGRDGRRGSPGHCAGAWGLLDASEVPSAGIQASLLLPTWRRWPPRCPLLVPLLHSCSNLWPLRSSGMRPSPSS